jgi:hypothetical protein
MTMFLFVAALSALGFPCFTGPGGDLRAQDIVTDSSASVRICACATHCICALVFEI